MSDREMILEALREYEENNYPNRDDEWQAQVNRLIDEYSK